jgi:hypothetical protein
MCSTCPPGAVSGGGAPSCSPCPAGDFASAAGASSCSSCAAGNYTSAVGSSACLRCGAFYTAPRSTLCCSGAGAGAFTAPANLTACAGCEKGSEPAFERGAAPSSPPCKLCAPGKFSPYWGSLCVACEVGRYSPAAGAAACAACPAGTYNRFPGMESVTQCLPCAPGSWSATNSSTCSACPAGTFSGASGAAGACERCPAGTASSASSAACSTCESGRYSTPGAALCASCDSGRYSSDAGANSSAACAACPEGTFNPLTASNSFAACVECGPGKFSAVPGSTACAVCPLGFTTASAASVSNASCARCIAGTYQPRLGAPCLPCPLSTFSTALGSTSVAACVPCPDGGSTDTPGAASPSACRAFKCGFGLQPLTPAVRTSADCAPIRCPPPLSLSADGAGCVGCGAGFFGAPPACAACAPNFTCPGFFAQALLAAPGALAAGAAPACAAAATLPRAVAAIPNQPASFSMASLPPLATLCVAAALAAAILAVLAYASLARARAWLQRAMKALDSFSLTHWVAPGQPLLNTPTALGGACTLLSLIAFFALATVLILQNAYANVAVQASLSTLLSSNPFSPAIPFAAPAASSPLAATLRGGVQVRILAQEGLGCTALAEGAPLLGSPEGWEVASTACGDGRTLLALSCAACAFGAASTLRFSLPYTCQSFYMEAVAVDALGVVNSVVFPPAASAASPTALLASLTWTVQVLGTILQDRIRDTSAQGYQLFAAAAEAATAPAGASIIPALAPVAVAIALPLQPTFSSTTLAPRQTLTELLSSIVGLLGIIGVFRVLFLAAELAQATAAARKRGRGGGAAAAAAPAAGEGPGGGGAEPLFVVTLNPLGERAAAAAAPAAVVWSRHRDDVDTWYTSSAGDTAWRLPPGAALAPGVGSRRCERRSSSGRQPRREKGERRMGGQPRDP